MSRQDRTSAVPPRLDAGVLTALLRLMGDAVILANLDGRVLEWSPGAERLYGWSADETRGRLYHDFISPDDAGGRFAEVRARVLGSGTLRRHATRRTKAGGAVITDVSITVVPGDDGAPVALLGIARDVTAQQSLLAQNIRLVTELRGTLATMRSLSGLLPLCAWCRKLKADDGQWRSLEDYVATETNGAVSHGICPECQARIAAEDPGLAGGPAL